MKTIWCRISLLNSLTQNEKDHSQGKIFPWLKVFQPLASQPHAGNVIADEQAC